MKDPAPDIAPSVDTLEFDLDDDLFDFDTLVEEAQRPVEVAREPELPEPALPAAVPAPAPRAVRAAPQVVPQAKPQPAPQEKPSAPPATPRRKHGLPTYASLRQTLGKVRASPKFVLALLVAILLNFMFTGVNWRSVHTLDLKVSEVDSRTALQSATSATRHAPGAGAPALSLVVPEPVIADVTSAKASATIDALQEELAKGDHSGARERLFAVLSTIDRPETEGAVAADVARLRAALVSRASLLIADSFRLQADALEADQLAVNSAPREPAEEHEH